jgi:uncharacterized protein
MLSFDLRSLETTAARVDADLAPDDPIWEEADLKPDEPVHVDGRLSAAGDGKFYFSGHISGSVEMPCRRCLEPVKASVSEEAHFIFAENGSEEAEDPDVYLFDPHAQKLDIRPAVRESWLLSAPAFLECREDCKGLCATCGTDLNKGSCDCVPVSTDSRWDALRKLGSKS